MSHLIRGLFESSAAPVDDVHAGAPLPGMDVSGPLNVHGGPTISLIYTDRGWSEATREQKAAFDYMRTCARHQEPAPEWLTQFHSRLSELVAGRYFGPTMDFGGYNYKLGCDVKESGTAPGASKQWFIVTAAGVIRPFLLAHTTFGEM
jgi:hypothetical protein